MKLTKEGIALLKKLMAISANKGNLANAGIVLENGKIIASAESLVVSSSDATAHSERMLVSEVCKLRHTNYTAGLTMVSVVEPCLMCLSACSQAGYKEIAFIIPAERYVEPIPWMTDIRNLDKEGLSKKFSNPLKYVHLKEHEGEFCKVFEKAMLRLLKK
ncbi:hypothetical protein A3A52_01045 [Candidatus Woesebacteria bacterium RIFCSPLOWO2_01_FULL_39_14]|uniref:CMP/dCMP-type deaminase domain-containing protein n=1 Tax=Candidatus Woesebacteria bacterium RIFCSPLOWO2_01_FULL_39_14 TaxID=1802518 RepID=A0A1F8BBH6_9BACT|nr:MAG: Cytosine/adenosine deaminase [Microgenomates group bacterium GW2011_GWC1_38_12]OGM61406.1 MAG: hypothetical protein A3A52_01045 [Candidatus Woesebacteria bacterium RIFCSPLOWO2_01_FULL_39_14]